MSYCCPPPYSYPTTTRRGRSVRCWSVLTSGRSRTYRSKWLAKLVGWLVQRVPPNERLDLRPSMFWWLVRPSRRPYPYRKKP